MLFQTLNTSDTSVDLCRVGKLLSSLNDDEAVYLKEVLNDFDKWSAQRIAVQLKKTQYPIGATTLKIHRRKECGCYL